MTGLSIASRRSAAKSQSQALKEQGTLKAEERAKTTKRLAGKQKASFLQSGISLTGEGTPQALIGETFDVGLEDIKQIQKNTGRGVSNIWSKARSGMLSDLGGFAMTVGMAGVGMGLGGAASASSPALPSGSPIGTGGITAFS